MRPLKLNIVDEYSKENPHTNNIAQDKVIFILFNL